jgi:plastocyanin
VQSLELENLSGDLRCFRGSVLRILRVSPGIKGSDLEHDQRNRHKNGEATKEPMKTTPAVLTISLILVSAYAGEYDDKETKEALSAPTEHYVATAHIDGNASTQGDANHPPEAIPDTEPPKGGGISISRGDQGKWRMRVFKFIPSQIICTVGEDVTIHFVGAQGPSHRIKVDGVEEEIQLKRGEIKTVTLHPTEKGVINFRSLDHQPSMNGQIIVIGE